MEGKQIEMEQKAVRSPFPQLIETKGHQSSVSPITSAVLSSLPEIVDSRISDKLARSRVYELLLLNAWRRRRTDVEKCNGKLKNTEKILLKSKEQQCTLESILRFEQQKYKKLEQAYLLLETDREELIKKHEATEKSNESLHAESLEWREEISQLTTSIETLQREFTDLAANESVLLEQISDYKKTIEVYQRECNLSKAENQRLAEEIEVKDDQYQQILRANNDLLQNEKNYIKTIEAKVINSEMLESDLEDLRSLCRDHQLAIEEKNAEVRRLRDVIDGAYSARLYNLAKNCLMLTTASLYRVSYHMLPALPPPPRVFMDMDDNDEISITRPSRPFGMIAPLLSVKTVSK